MWKFVSPVHPLSFVWLNLRCILFFIVVTVTGFDLSSWSLIRVREEEATGWSSVSTEVFNQNAKKTGVGFDLSTWSMKDQHTGGGEKSSVPKTVDRGRIAKPGGRLHSLGKEFNLI